MILYILLYLVQKAVCIDDVEGWNYINLHCRDNHNLPVDWWYIFKPPSEGVAYLELGYNFSYIASNDVRRWQTSDRHITSNSMLQHSVWPMFKQTYGSRVAYVVYDWRRGGVASDSAALGVLMADEIGGLWIGHSVPGFPDVTRRYPEFPREEGPNGHLMYCLSLDLATVNEIAVSLAQSKPKIIAMKVPSLMKTYVPTWTNLMKNTRSSRKDFNERAHKDNFDFVSRSQTLQASIRVRPPGQTNCLYEDFARTRAIVLDVYGHNGKDSHHYATCSEAYSLRTIERISLKRYEQVSYIAPRSDRAKFAVSTAAHWQRRGAGTAQYWTCLEHGDRPDEGGVMFCVENYHIWANFDNLKVAEPTRR